jgi:hypothetical protein
MRHCLRFALAFACLSTAWGANFEFNVLIRAGLQGNGDWEAGMGLNSNGVPAASAHMTPYYLDGQPQRFEIGYTAATGQAFTRIYTNTLGNVLALNLLYSVPNATVASTPALPRTPVSPPPSPPPA